VARNFKAEVIDRAGRPWIKVWFYWPKDAAGAQDLAARIDAGVLREVSIGFEFKRPECSVCGRDIRECEHQPFAESRRPDGQRGTVHYLYRDIVRVLETSLVYRGATPGTRIGSGLFFRTRADADVGRPHEASIMIERLFEVGLTNAAPIRSVADCLDDDPGVSRLVVAPLIEGLPLVVCKQERNVALYTVDQQNVSAKIPRIGRELLSLAAGDFSGFGWLVRPRPQGTRGPLTVFMEFLGTVHDEEYYKRPIIDHYREVSRLFRAGRSLRPVPYRWVDRAQAARAAQLLSSTAGYRIYPADRPAFPPAASFELRRRPHLWLQIIDRQPTTEGQWQYTLALADHDDFNELADPVISAQRYPLGRIVPVTGALSVSPEGNWSLTDPAIRYTPARREQPDSLPNIRRFAVTKREHSGVRV
jgi:hypothetical protein